MAIFFFDTPPQDIPDPVGDFRLEHQGFFEQDVSKLISIINYHYALQFELESLEAQSVFANNIKQLKKSSDLIQADGVRKWLDISVHDVSGVRSPSEKLNYYKRKLEHIGVYVFQASLKEQASGFCLYHNRYPIICLNSAEAPSRRIFTLFHELAHLLYENSSVYVEDLLKRDLRQNHRLERQCNQLAADLLIPDSYITSIQPSAMISIVRIKELAENHSKELGVSKYAFLTKLAGKKMLGRGDYQTITEQWDQEYNHQQQEGSKEKRISYHTVKKS
jgi:Zn-dependent peptidase ImmA (M78 family)